jgi:hypothetical protein
MRRTWRIHLVHSGAAIYSYAKSLRIIERIIVLRLKLIEPIEEVI